MSSTSGDGVADRPERIAWHVARARERAGLSLEAGAAAAGISVEALDALEAGWREPGVGEIERLASAYGMAPEEVLPPRTPVVVDPEAHTFALGDRSAPFGEAPDDALSTYLSMIYELRGVRRGQRIALRDDDIDVLAGLVGDDADEVEARLIELMECSPEDARKLRALLFRRRVVAAAAGIALGLGVASMVKYSPGVGDVGVAAGTDLADEVVFDPAWDGEGAAGVVLPSVFGSQPPSESGVGDGGTVDDVATPAASEVPPSDVPSPDGLAEPPPALIDIGTPLVIVAPAPTPTPPLAPPPPPPIPQPDDAPDELPEVDVPDQVPPVDESGPADGDADGDSGVGDITDEPTDETDETDEDASGGGDGNNGQGVGVGGTPPGHSDDVGGGPPGDVGGDADDETDDDAAGGGDSNNGQGVGVGGTPPGHQGEHGSAGNQGGGNNGGNDGDNSGQGFGVGETPPGHEGGTPAGTNKKA